jgi:hypothetical protein
MVAQLKGYGIAAGYNIERYTVLPDYPKGNQDESYYSEIWLPVKKITIRCLHLLEMFFLNSKAPCGAGT